jgi:hypothetical protein
MVAWRAGIRAGKPTPRCRLNEASGQDGPSGALRPVDSFLVVAHSIGAPVVPGGVAKPRAPRTYGAGSVPDLRDRRLIKPEADTPFDHQHYGQWVEMTLVSATETVRDGMVRRTRTYVCPSCTYELTESEPIALAGRRSEVA